MKGSFSVDAFWIDARNECVDGERCEALARYIILHCATVRMAAKSFGISKSTVHKEVTVRLRSQNAGLYEEVREILEKNKAERHLRGGEATKRRYEEEKNRHFGGEKNRADGDFASEITATSGIKCQNAKN